MATPFVPQGTLNRVRSSVIVPGFPSLNVTSSYMGKDFVTVSFQGSFAELIPTATGGVTSPEPYVMASVAINILRTQSLSEAWRTQAEALSAIGPITVHSDSAAFPALSFDNCIIRDFEPGAYNGMDPVVRVTLQGIYYINNQLWSM
jgi:hypothetical protein